MNVRDRPQKNVPELVESQTRPDLDPRRIAHQMKHDRVPGLLVPPYAPPIAPCVPNAREQWSTELTEDHEAALQRVPLPSGGRAPVLVTKKRWQACDVYVDGVNDATAAFTGGNANAMLTINLYASARGILTLVSSGRISAGNIAQAPVWMASGRQAAEQWVVELEYNGTVAPAQELYCDVAIVATDCDQIVSADECTATRPVGPTETLGSAAAVVNYPTTLGAGVGSPFQLIALNATSLSATNNYLHVHDLNNITVAGVAPMYSFTITNSVAAPGGAPAGLISGNLSALFRRRRFRNGITLAVSTTAITTTLQAAGVVAFNGYFR